MIRRALVIAALAWSACASADLYRWVDPETGSVKFSSYPPPWFGDEARARRAPRVEVIPAGKAPAPAEEEAPPRPEASPEKPEAAPARAAEGRPEPAPRTGEGKPPPVDETASLVAERREILQTLMRMASQPGLQVSAPAFRRQLDSYRSLSVELDRRDPLGAATRRFEAQPLLDKLTQTAPSAGGPR
jgi:hypothetical protein